MEILNKILEEKQFKKYEKIKQFSIHTYEDANFDSLMNLYERVFPGYMSNNLWLWKNINNPCGHYNTILMKDNDKIISAFSEAPREFCINRKTYSCVQGQDIMTDPDYRGLGINAYLARLTDEYSKRKGAYFTYGYTNDYSRNLMVHKVGWNPMDNKIFLVKKIPSNLKDSTINLKNYSIKEIKSFNENFNEFWEECKNNYPIMINRTSEFLNWRFFNHPFVKYKIFSIQNDNKNKIVAYFILKKYKDEKTGDIFGHIVDFIIGPRNNPIKENLFRLIESYSLTIFKDECSKISFWLPDENLKKIALRHLGYDLIVSKEFFVYKIFIDNKQLSILKSLKNWYHTMINSDVF